MKGVKAFWGYLAHTFTAHTRYHIHSPFVYHFVTKVLPHRRSEAGEKVERLRKDLASQKDTLSIEDFGAGYGGVSRPSVQKTIAEVVKSSARSRREGELLYRIANAYQPQNILELGTNLGFSSLYLQLGAPNAALTTLEGSQHLTQWAIENHRKLGSKATIIHTQFEDWLANDLGKLGKVDLLFLDGNHRKEPTLEYVQRILPHMREGGMIVLDDIRWSNGMEEAWNELIKWPELNVCLDLYFLGICFVQRPQAREYFRLRFRPI